jgi:hypothetical protein
VPTVDVFINQVTYNNGYVAITVIGGLLVGAGVAVLVVFLLHRFMCQNPFAALQQKLSKSPPVSVFHLGLRIVQDIGTTK